MRHRVAEERRAAQHHPRADDRTQTRHDQAGQQRTLHDVGSERFAKPGKHAYTLNGNDNHFQLGCG